VGAVDYRDWAQAATDQDSAAVAAVRAEQDLARAALVMARRELAAETVLPELRTCGMRVPAVVQAVVQAAAPVVVLVAERVLRKGLGQEVWEDREQASVASGTVAEALVAALARDQGAAPVRGLEVAERVQGRAAEKE